MITQAELKEILHYDPDTGEFTWLVSPAKNVKSGDRAGCLADNGYRHIGINGNTYKEHRLAWLYFH